MCRALVLFSLPFICVFKHSHNAGLVQWRGLFSKVKCCNGLAHCYALLCREAVGLNTRQLILSHLIKAMASSRVFLVWSSKCRSFSYIIFSFNLFGTVLPTKGLGMLQMQCVRSSDCVWNPLPPTPLRHGPTFCNYKTIRPTQWLARCAEVWQWTSLLPSLRLSFYTQLLKCHFSCEQLRTTP